MVLVIEFTGYPAIYGPKRQCSGHVKCESRSPLVLDPHVGGVFG